MTQGSILRHILLFSLPLLIGNLFQQLYNTVDTIIIGNYVGKEALAAVGSVGPVINMLIGFFNGFASGAGVLISQHYGAHDDKQVHAVVQTIIVLTLILSVVLSVLGVGLTPLLLRLMKTPEDVFDLSREYLQIYFAGMAGLLLYNMGSGILRAVGDSKRPLYFLILAALLNTGLDILFVVKLEMGVAGVAIATVIAQLISAALVLAVLTAEQGSHGIRWRKLALDLPVTKRIFTIGFPSALQMAVVAFSNIFVQSYINRFGSVYMSGWAAYIKIDAFAMLPTISLALAVTTFVGQNLGAKEMERAHRGTKITLVAAILIAIAILLPLMGFAPQLILLFNREAEVVACGTLFIRMISPFYLMLVVSQILTSALRGAGDTKASLFLSLGAFVLFRQIYLKLVFHFWPSVVPVVMGYPAGWVVGGLLAAIYYGRVKRKRRGIS